MYLFIKNLKTSRPNWKLDYKKISLFIIKNKKSNITFELELSKKIKIHLIFYILFLESANPNILIQNKLLKLLLENKYKIEEIENYNIFTN